MTLASFGILRYRTGMRVILALFAALAIFLSGTHAGPAEAHEKHPMHASEHHAQHQDDGGSKQDDGRDQHGCHHHCPSTAASHSDEAQTVDYFARAHLFPLNTAPLVSTTRAPPLNPPKA
jgi:hypothetical protein